MKKFNLKFKSVSVDELDDRTLLLNVYFTQALVLIIGLIIFWFERRFPTEIFTLPSWKTVVFWGGAFAIVVFVVDISVTRFVPEDVLDDGGINQRIFGKLPLWHIVVLSFLVAVCEELLFRGAIQAAWGPYWTSILFAAIHFRYLRHWLMTGMVFGISYGLGWIYIQTGTLWTPIAAHFLIDLIMGCMLRYRRK